MKKLFFTFPIVVLLAAGCNSSSQPSSPTASNPSSQQQTNQTPPVNNDAQNWKTYTSSSFGFSIQYPSNWSVDSQRSSANEVVFNNGSPESHISISVRSYSKTVADWKNSLDQTVITQTKTISIGGQSGIELYSGEMGGLAGQAGVIYNGQLYIFNEVDSMPATMLASFKFGQSTSASSNKTYASNYGYQLTYSNDYNLEATDPAKVGFRNKFDKATDVYGNKIPADVTVEYFGDLNQLPYYQNHPTSIKTIDDYFAQNGTDKSMYNITSYKNQAGDLVYSFTDAGLKSVYTELIPHNGHYYQLSFCKRETGDQLNTDEKQIEQTFKLTN